MESITSFLGGETLKTPSQKFPTLEGKEKGLRDLEIQ